MASVLQQASHLLCHNDADALEELCAQLAGTAPSAPPPAERAAYGAQLLVLRRQVLAARSNILLRQRLRAQNAPGHTGQHCEAPWAP